MTERTCHTRTGQARGGTTETGTGGNKRRRPELNKGRAGNGDTNRAQSRTGGNRERPGRHQNAGELGGDQGPRTFLGLFASEVGVHLDHRN